jgi:riboflavin synthase
MFTGIIEEVGQVKKLEKMSGVYLLEIEAGFSKELSPGDSVAVNGACLTVVFKDSNSFGVEVTGETYRRTNFRFLKSGDYVNLERALKADGRFDGHFVTGHVDGVGEVVRFAKTERAAEMYLKVPEELEKFVAEKGSLAVDGISLTVASLEGELVRISLIPLTLEKTNLKFRRQGDKVNLEIDIIARYIYRLLEKRKESESLRRFLEGR